MNNLLSLQFWFNLRPEALMPIYQKLFIIIVVILIILTIFLAIIQSRNKKNLYGNFWSKLYYFSLANTIIGLFFLFFTYETVPFLSARFWFFVWAVEIFIWLYFLVRILLRIPKRKKQLAEEERFKKYIP